ncbi:TLC domain-containing protein 2 [Armadillidium nasatum]|uniref:TLC domain-containing protein 2 n=1 Tax=Armadillidium nasatum TaxID=96803 RepID=A0A5N5TJC4_9CRUS|nr:TLC domain-containing protein 2 [Armadillidium nasatum]
MYLKNIESYFGLISIFVSFWIFFILNKSLTFVIPKAVLKTDKEKWKWKNIMISLIHSVVAGLWAVICFFLFPEMAEDLINSYSTLAHMLVSFSVGLAVIVLMNIVLFIRICSTDFSNKRKSDTKSSESREYKISKEEMMNSTSSNTFFANTQNFHLD